MQSRAPTDRRRAAPRRRRAAAATYRAAPARARRRGQLHGMGAAKAMILPSSAAALLVIVCLATPVSLAVPAQLPTSPLERRLESAADSLVQEVNSAALAATASAGKTPGGPYGLALTPYMGWRRCADAVAPHCAMCNCVVAFLCLASFLLRIMRCAETAGTRTTTVSRRN